MTISPQVAALTKGEGDCPTWARHSPPPTLSAISDSVAPSGMRNSASAHAHQRDALLAGKRVFAHQALHESRHRQQAQPLDQAFREPAPFAHDRVGRGCGRCGTGHAIPVRSRDTSRRFPRETALVTPGIGVLKGPERRACASCRRQHRFAGVGHGPTGDGESEQRCTALSMGKAEPGSNAGRGRDRRGVSTACARSLSQSVCGCPAMVDRPETHRRSRELGC